MGPSPSPQSSQTNAEETAYLEKLKQLRKYIEPLKHMVARIEGEEGTSRPGPTDVTSCSYSDVTG